jgi:hypothetical protein
LLTPDDEARLREDLLLQDDMEFERTLTGQARPNVIFESGMALASHPNRTVLVQFGNLRPFSDVSGLHILRMDGSAAKRKELAQRLEDAGCPVNLQGERWLTVGDLHPASPTISNTATNDAPREPSPSGSSEMKIDAPDPVASERAWIMVDLRWSTDRPKIVEMLSNGIPKVSIDVCLVCQNGGRTLAWIREVHFWFRGVDALAAKPEMTSSPSFVEVVPEPLNGGRLPKERWNWNARATCIQTWVRLSTDW